MSIPEIVSGCKRCGGRGIIMEPPHPDDIYEEVHASICPNCVGVILRVFEKHSGLKLVRERPSGT